MSDTTIPQERNKLDLLILDKPIDLNLINNNTTGFSNLVAYVEFPLNPNIERMNQVDVKRLGSRVLEKINEKYQSEIDNGSFVLTPEVLAEICFSVSPFRYTKWKMVIACILVHYDKENNEISPKAERS